MEWHDYCRKLCLFLSPMSSRVEVIVVRGCTILVCKMYILFVHFKGGEGVSEKFLLYTCENGDN